MPGFWTEEGTAVALELMVKAGITVHLFTNPVTPTKLTPLADFVEPQDAGYKVQKFEKGKTSIKVGDPSTCTHDVMAFAFAVNLVPHTIRGWYLVCQGRAAVVELFKVDGEARPVVVTTPGSVITVIPTLTLRAKRAD